FAPGRTGRRGEAEGVAILSRHPIVATERIALSSDRRDPWDRFGPRVALWAVVDLPRGPLALVVTHLSISRRARTRTVPELLHFLGRLPARCSILIGDLTADPGEPSLEALRSSGWRDAWSGPGARPGRRSPPGGGSITSGSLPMAAGRSSPAGASPDRA